MAEREQWMRLRVGIFVLGLMGLFIVFVLTIGSRSQIFERRYSLHAYFSNIEGLNVGAPVRLAGTSIGSVDDITFSKDLASKKIRVTVSLDARLQDRIREDSIASIGTIGLVGDKVLELTVGSPNKPVLSPDATIASVDPPDYATLLQKGDQIVNNVVKISGALNQLVGGGAGVEARQDLAESIASFNRIMKEIEQGTGLLHALVYEKRSGNILKELSDAATALQQLSSIMKQLQNQKGLAHILFADPRAESLMADLEQTSRNLKSVSGRLAQGEGTLGALIDDPTLYEDLSSLLRGANRSRILRSLIQSTRRSGADTDPQ
ncbi:Mce family protein [Candidatus Methylomirabilis lanthanidiphila]|uniref:Mce family protein n=1 Tax=Candidatus Methylomirabilis lanthanidiphila TaxID=2211376 RepID=A0A564ZFH2_9BACT|nr:MlaD family protein [Candidatus Methylomirabilis lanthanidiphila]VUZ84075.1 Mce family protein [Candidatus Methylomirabilis lanthanidiphila]